MGETYRTLLGHFRHEIGHYYWDRLVEDGPRIDGVPRALRRRARRLRRGAQAPLRRRSAGRLGERFVSAYASMHPWEDWAETWAHYLHMIDTLETARAYGLSLRPGRRAPSPSRRCAPAHRPARVRRSDRRLGPADRRAQQPEPQHGHARLLSVRAADTASPSCASCTNHRGERARRAAVEYCCADFARSTTIVVRASAGGTFLQWRRAKQENSSMSSQHVAWGSIELLHNVVRTLTHLHDLGRAFPVSGSRAKVKLHGTNCAVRSPPTASSSPRAGRRCSTRKPTTRASRTGRATTRPTSIARGRRVVLASGAAPASRRGWQSRRLATKLFAVLRSRTAAASCTRPTTFGAGARGRRAGRAVRVAVGGRAASSIDYGRARSLEAAAAECSKARVAAVERDDSCGSSAASASGLGEGLVFYPARVDGGAPDPARANLEPLMFKAKGRSTAAPATRTAVQVDAPWWPVVDDFVR